MLVLGLEGGAGSGPRVGGLALGLEGGVSTGLAGMGFWLGAEGPGPASGAGGGGQGCSTAQIQRVGSWTLQPSGRGCRHQQTPCKGQHGQKCRSSL